MSVPVKSKDSGSIGSFLLDMASFQNGSDEGVVVKACTRLFADFELRRISDSGGGSSKSLKRYQKKMGAIP